MKASPLLLQVRKKLKETADPARAPAMQAYMKSEMPFHSVGAPKVRAICREIFAGYPFRSGAAWRRDVLGLWRGATHREERYAAVSLSGHHRAEAFQTVDILSMYEEMIVDGAWWDYVDEIATHRVGALLRRSPAPMRRTMLRWSRCDDMWKRRTAILCQIRFGKETDLKLLHACIEPSLDSKEFFLRKAIGWALRQYAWVDPEYVAGYVTEDAARLSPLSKREALKNVSRLLAGSARRRG
jgi:3-methyladenine DNA glycosylase AlkD